MSRANAGRIFIVTQGVHTGKVVIALNKEQHREIQQQGKFCVYVTDAVYQGNLFDVPELTGKEKRVLIATDFLKLTGFID